jgi:copper(I)-binding protein
MKNIFADLKVVAVLFLWSGLCIFPHVALADNSSVLLVEKAWSPEMPPNMRMIAGYMSAINVSKNPIKITSVSSSVYQSVEIHRTVIEDGVANMMAVESLLINPNERMELSPGGLHFMLMNRNSINAADKSVPINLHLENGGLINVVLTIVPRNQQPSKAVDAHDHSAHKHHGS